MLASIDGLMAIRIVGCLSRGRNRERVFGRSQLTRWTIPINMRETILMIRNMAKVSSSGPLEDTTKVSTKTMSSKALVK